MINENPKPYQEFNLGGMKFDRKVFEKCVEAAKESGIVNEDLLKQTAFQMYYGELQLKSTNRIKNNVVFWFWITAGWILIALLGGLGIGVLSQLF
jgi:hypothetical protein